MVEGKVIVMWFFYCVIRTVPATDFSDIILTWNWNSSAEIPGASPALYFCNISSACILHMNQSGFLSSAKSSSSRWDLPWFILCTISSDVYGCLSGDSSYLVLVSVARHCRTCSFNLVRAESPPSLYDLSVSVCLSPTLLCPTNSK